MVYTYPLELMVDTMLAHLGQPIQDGIAGGLRRFDVANPGSAGGSGQTQ